MEYLLSALILSVAANLDSLVIALSYSLNNQVIPLKNQVLIGIFTSLGTLVSMILGSVFLLILPSPFPNIIGGSLMVIIGLYFFLHMETDADPSIPTIITMRNTLMLTLILTINNIGAGIAAGMTHIKILPTVIFTFTLTILFFQIGDWLVKYVKTHQTRKYLSILSSVILIILGLYEAFI